MGSPVPNKTALVVILVILAVAISLLVTSYDYSSGSELFPRFTGWLFVALSLLELLLQLRPFLSHATPDVGDPGVPTSTRETVSKELRGFLWIGLFLALLYFVGFLVAIPLYIFSFLRVSAKRKVWVCAVYAASAVIFVDILFVQFMHYKLYPGVLLGG